jgi:chromosome segregation ATPase
MADNNAYQFQLHIIKELAENNITEFTDEDLSAEFIEARDAFLQGVADGNLTPEEVQSQDQRLIQLFDSLHSFEDVNDDEREINAVKITGKLEEELTKFHTRLETQIAENERLRTELEQANQRTTQTETEKNKAQEQVQKLQTDLDSANAIINNKPLQDYIEGLYNRNKDIYGSDLVRFGFNPGSNSEFQVGGFLLKRIYPTVSPMYKINKIQ